MDILNRTFVCFCLVKMGIKLFLNEKVLQINYFSMIWEKYADFRIKYKMEPGPVCHFE